MIWTYSSRFLTAQTSGSRSRPSGIVLKGNVLLELREANYQVRFKDPRLMDEPDVQAIVGRWLVSHDWQREASMLELDGTQLRVFLFRRYVDWLREAPMPGLDGAQLRVVPLRDADWVVAFVEQRIAIE